MQHNFLPLSRPALDEKDILAVTEVLRSGWITTGPKNTELERAILDYTDAKHAVCVSSATAALHLVLVAYGIGHGDEVITPSMTWVSTINLITLMGAKPVFVDVDPQTLMTNAELIEPLITAHTKLIIPVHFAGSTLDLDPIYALSQRHNIPVIEDAAHALGASYHQRPIGQQGTCIFSLHAIKNITTAEGGVLTTHDDQLAKRIRRLKFHGLEVDAFDRELQGRSPQAEVVEPGFKYNLPDICAVLALGQLKRIDEITSVRRQLAEEYLSLLGNIVGITPLGIPAYQHKHCWHLMVVRVDESLCGISRDHLIARLKEQGIGAGIHFRACHTHKYYVENYQSLFGDINPNLSHTETNSRQICSLPLFPDMGIDDVHRVISTIQQILEKSHFEK